MNLAIDIGNAFANPAIIENGQVVDFLRTEAFDRTYIIIFIIIFLIIFLVTFLCHKTGLK